MTLRNGVALVFFGAAAAATWWWGRPPAAGTAVRRDRGIEPPGYYLKGAQLLGTDENGRVTYRVHAERIEELPDQGLLVWSGVRIEYRPADAVPWEIDAARASAPKDGSHFDLEGEVELRSEPTDGSGPTVVSAPSLHFTPDESSARSDRAVSVQIGDWRLTGVGLRVHLKDDKLELESNVHGQIAR